MGRFRYWLLGDFIQKKDGATMLNHRIFAARYLVRPTYPGAFSKDTNVVYFIF